MLAQQFLQLQKEKSHQKSEKQLSLIIVQMQTKGLLLCLILFFQIADQTTVCGKNCQQGVNCCRTIFTPIKFLSQFSAQCGTGYCRAGEGCYRNTCVPIELPIPYKLPKPTEYGALDRAVPPYGLYYCQQNIYNLCLLFDRVKKPTAQGFAVIVQGVYRTGAIFRQQKLGKSPPEYGVQWNFHVIFLLRDGNQVQVYDFDSRLQWGAEFQVVWQRALKTPDDTNVFRVIEYKQYLNFFSSDRKLYSKYDPKKYPPPTKNSINVNKYKKPNEIKKFLDFTNYDPNYGVIMTADQFYKKFGKKKLKA